MAYTQQTWQDGVTPVDAERMNHIEGGVADLSDAIDEITDTGILDKKIVTNSSDTVTILTGTLATGGTSYTLETTSGGVVFCVTNYMYGGAWVWRNGHLYELAANQGSFLDVSLSGTDLTITNNHNSNACRYFAITT